ncbi:MAG: sulfur carrier protein ThiS [Actinomycetota bacterium]
MKIIVNGESTELEPGATVLDVIERVGRDPSVRGVAVALNGQVVPRSSWNETQVSEEDRVEVLSAVQGG